MKNKTTKPRTDSSAKQLCKDIRAGKNDANTLIEEYFNDFSESMKQFFFDHEKGKKDEESNYDLTIDSINEFLHYRDEVARVFLCIARHLRDNEDSTNQVHKFFEHLIPYCNQHEGQGNSSFYEQSDNLVFLVHEMFLYAIAAFIEARNFKGVAYLTNTPYRAPNIYGSETMISFTNIRQPAKSFGVRNKKKEPKRMSLRAHLLLERTEASEFSLQQIIQADTCLQIKSFVARQEPAWYPETLIYCDRCTSAFEIFDRAQSRKYFEQIKIMWKTEQSEEITRALISSTIDKIHTKFTVDWEGSRDLGRLINPEKLYQLP